VRATPVLLCERDVRAHWCTADPESADKPAPPRSSRADRVFDVLQSQGASFFADLVHDSGMLRADVEQGLGELVGQGLVSCDSFAGLRALILPAARRQRLRRLGRVAADIDSAGRWSLTRRSRPVPPVSSPGGSAAGLADPAVEHIARALLQRYGVVFKALLVREERLPPWRDLHYVYRRLEARGEICGGRFVNGFVGEQFALPDAATQLRKCVEPPEPQRITLSAADPLNLAGIITPGERLPKLSGNRIMFENGLPVAVQAGGEVRYLVELEPAEEWAVKTALIRRRRPGLEIEPSTRLQ
jgi:ATP-dependent Lhr-like helicase